LADSRNQEGQKIGELRHCQMISSPPAAKKLS
jgi:hypothetical protein